MIPHQQPLPPAPALLAPEPPSDVLEQHVPPTPRYQCLVVQFDTPVARLTARTEGERLVISHGAEDEAAGRGGHDPKSHHALIANVHAATREAL